MRLSAVLAVAFLIAISCLPLSSASGQDAKLEVKNTDTVRTILERQIGKRVAVVLTTGPELAGVVTTVGDKVVLLSELSGREFYDAVVNLEQIGAVIIRTRTSR
ncbi:MAG TPA: hypothetical protein VEL75_11920 [Candidatus Methylomirabilis sp.]|nr:hypothetical protein [Candidatus Methylomirabilis sp.]